MMRRTKIIATLGPCSSFLEGISNLISARMNIARINLLHGDRKNHTNLIQAMKVLHYAKRISYFLSTEQCLLLTR